MRVPGWGDWWFEGDVLHVRSVNDDPDCNPFLIALHELVECWLCKERGITAEQVDAFDAAFELKRVNEDDEPGDDPAAPYHRQHRFACLIEFMTALELGIVDYGVMR
jgi:hypothetical protein